jgi:hypothetical protein
MRSTEQNIDLYLQLLKIVADELCPQMQNLLEEELKLLEEELRWADEAEGDRA